ncbi:unnamed protein product [Durusdinium trenchii]|uniref:Uncharacterized protein n=1 Tax=Durusdinium trenchii TaxID=1381693 RepID=A0ABP0KMI2_9DINO
MDSFSDDAELSLSQILEAMIDEEAGLADTPVFQEEKPHLQLEETHVVQEESDGAGRAECAQNQAQDEDGCRTPDRCENEPHSQVNGALRTPKKKGDVAVEPLSSSKTVSLKRFASDVASDEVKHQEDLEWEVVWQQLEAQGWRMDFGPRGMGVQVYYMPPGVWRGPGKKNRIDYFDSKKLVMQLIQGGVDIDHSRKYTQKDIVLHTFLLICLQYHSATCYVQFP